MSYFEFPHARTYDSDLGWLIQQLKKLTFFVETINKNSVLKLADPPVWDITRQYPPNIIVIDENTGAGYVSSQPVPAGVDIGNTEYWTRIVDINTVSDKLYVYDTTQSAMAADMGTGVMVITFGYATPGDRGNGAFEVVGEEPEDGLYLPMENGNFLLWRGEDVPTPQLLGGFPDDTTDLTSLVSRILTQCGAIHFPSADGAEAYIVGPLDVGNQMEITGDGYKSHLAPPVGVTSQILNVAGNHVRVRGLRLDGRNRATGIKLTSAHFCQVENIYADYCTVGMEVSGGGDNIVSNLWCMNLRQNGIICNAADVQFDSVTVGICQKTGFYAPNCTMIQISNSKFYQCGLDGSEAYGVDLGSYSAMTGCIIQDSWTRALRVNGFNEISGLLIESTNFATFNGGASAGTSYNVTVRGTNNHLEGTVIDGYFVFSDVLLQILNGATGNDIDLQLGKVKVSNTASGSNRIVTAEDNSQLQGNSVKVAGKHITGDMRLNSGGLPLDGVTDLNDVTTYGHYYTSSGSNSIANAPFTGGFTMDVVSSLGAGEGAYQYIRQIVTQYNSPFTTWQRMHSLAGGTWTAWMKVTPVAV